MRAVRRWWLLVIVAALLALPAPTPGPASMSLVRIETASAVDFGDGVVWVLAVGSDAAPGQDVDAGRADAIQLVGVDVDEQRAFALGIPRDFYLDVPGEGMARINTGLQTGGADLMARLVRDLTGITPQYVVTSKPSRFADMVDEVGGLTVVSRLAFTDEERGLTVRKGPNDFTGTEAADFAGSREPLPRSDLDRSANHQALLRAVLDKVRERADEEGFLEVGAAAALAGLDTNLSPSEIFRFANAVTEIDPRRVQACVLEGRPQKTADGALVLIPDVPRIKRLAEQVRDDAHLDREPQQIGC